MVASKSLIIDKEIYFTNILYDKNLEELRKSKNVIKISDLNNRLNRLIMEDKINDYSLNSSLFHLLLLYFTKVSGCRMKLNKKEFKKVIESSSNLTNAIEYNPDAWANTRSVNYLVKECLMTDMKNIESIMINKYIEGHRFILNGEILWESTS